MTIDLSLPLMFVMFFAIPAVASRLLAKRKFGASLFASNWTWLFFVSGLSALIPAIIATAFYRMTYDDIGELPKLVQFSICFIIIALIPCLLAGYWTYRRHPADLSKDMETFE